MGERSIQEKYQAWRKCPGMNEELHNQLKAMSPDELNDSFYRSLAFGTGGLRGVLGAGENRMNLYTVSKATRGLGRYLLETCEKPSCAVSCDSRIHSRDFAELTAATLAEMGIRVYLYRTLMPTPMLSYAVRHLHTSAGVMVTASHNPAKFNGYKVYGADGCQITIEAADRIYSFISAEQTLQPSLPSFQKYLDNGMVSYIDDETIESYYQMIDGLRIAPTDERLHIVYSPLNGTGNVPVREMLKRMGNIDVDVVAEPQKSRIPVINAGDGGHQHPTQTLTDLMTIRSLKGRLGNITIGLCGDLKFGRTVHSLINALIRYENVKFILISPEELKIPDYIREDVLQANHVEFEEVERLEDAMSQLDVLYMTRVQRERFFNEEDYIRLKDFYILTKEKMELAKDDMIVLHPLPRVNEISVEVDDDPRAAYFTQVQNGVYVRMALILTLLGIEVE